MRKFINIDEQHGPQFWSALPNWLDAYEVGVFQDSNGFDLNGHNPRFKKVAAIGKLSETSHRPGNHFDELKRFLEREDWAFGFFTYDLKNEVENLTSSNDDEIQMPEMYFFQPRWIFIEDKDGLRVGFDDSVNSEQDINVLLSEIENYKATERKSNSFEIKSKVSRGKYLENIAEIKNHIQYGDVYELNYCIEHYAENAVIDPVNVYRKLNEANPAPFSSFCKVGDKYLISASPERFIKKDGGTVISQPMKGTVRRGADNAEDEHLKQQLYDNPKERAENVMIVDLVRNDLSHSAKKGSVKVDELFGIYTFPHVHQMISTVKCELRDDVHTVDAIKQTFPMGSMTGAPKIRAMELIEQYEVTKRGLFSGSVGYFTPEGDFDFNVIIRSILYNSHNKYVSFMTGGAITINSNPEQEYEECLLKARAMKQALS